MSKSRLRDHRSAELDRAIGELEREIGVPTPIG
jgi:hypothetical protein